MNLYFFGFLNNGQIFASKVRNFQYNHRFLFSTEMGNIRMCKEKRLQKLIKAVWWPRAAIAKIYYHRK